MAEGFETQPKILKGAIVQLRKEGLIPIPIPNIIVFQFNPETITRGKRAISRVSLTSTQTTQNGEGDTVKQEAEKRNPDFNLEFQQENITLLLRLDATDRLSRNQAIAVANGVLPELSALELLMYPKKPAFDLSIDDSGGAQSSPQLRDETLFIWGPFRIIPVTVTGVSITEQVFDALLNPIRAQVEVTMQVLEAAHLKNGSSILEAAFTYTQGVKEVQALLNIANTVEAVGIEIPFL